MDAKTEKFLEEVADTRIKVTSEKNKLHAQNAEAFYARLKECTNEDGTVDTGKYIAAGGSLRDLDP